MINTKKLLLTTTIISSTMIMSNAFAQDVQHVKHYNDKSAYEKATSKTITTFHESPYIKKYMSKLAPINERLKDLDPLIEQPSHEIGTYGGQANVLTLLPYQGQDTVGFMPFDMLLGLESDNSTIISGFAQSYKLSKDMKTITFTLRKGLKWSDGVPVTSQELSDWHKYIIEGLKMPTDLNGFTLKVINSRVFSITLDHANALMANLFADFAGSQIMKPFHYIKHFLPQFNKHITEEAKKAGFLNATMYAKAEVNSFNVAPVSLRTRINLPSLSAYVLTAKSDDHWTFTRNPYYWKVDTAGNQLPYVDKLQVKLMNSTEVLIAKILAGDADYSVYNNASNRITIFKQNEKKGNYKTYIWSLSFASMPAVSFNISYNGPDKVGLKIIQDIRFRRAFSLSIDRDKMNDVLYYGKAKPTQMTVHNTSKYYKKEYAETYAQYDLKKANKLLDDMGLKWDSRHKYRIRPDGKSLEFLIPIIANGGTVGPIYEMMQTFAGRVGIHFILKDTPWVISTKNKVNGNVNLMSFSNASGTTDPVMWIHPKLFVPYSSNNINDAWGMNYAKWFDSQNKHTKTLGIEPPQYIKDLYNTHLKLLATNDPAQRAILADKILKAQADHLFTVGTIGNPPKPITARDNVGNMDDYGYSGVDNKWCSNYAPETRFFKRPLHKNQIVK